MAIERTVETNVYCDICGEWIIQEHVRWSIL